jgi:hypothetical protein
MDSFVVGAIAIYLCTGVMVFMLGLVQSIWNGTLRRHGWALPGVFVVVVLLWPVSLIESNILTRRGWGDDNDEI